MGWVRVSDDFYDHPKFNEAGPLGTALWLAGMAYCNRNLTDGFIPRAKARGLLDFEGTYVETPGGELIKPMSGEFGDWVATALTVSGLWHEDGHDCPDCPQPGPRAYYVHDYLDYQPSKEQVEETRAKRVDAGRKGGQAKQSAKQLARQGAKQVAKQTVYQNRSKNVPPIPSPNPNPNPTPKPFQDSNANHQVPQVVGAAATDLTSVARFRKFDPAAVRAELAVVIPEVSDEEIVNVATYVLDKAPGVVRNATRYLIAAIQNDEYHIEDIAYGQEATA